MQLIIGYLKAIERVDGQDVKPRTAIDEGLGDLDVADDRRAEHWESTGGCGALELVRRAESDGVLGPPERACGLKLGKSCVHLMSKLLEDT